MRTARIPRLSQRHRALLARLRGFNAIEVMLVVGLVAVTAGLSVPMYRNFQIRSDLDLTTEQIASLLRRAQILSKNVQDDSAWGVYVREGTLFAGDAYVLRNTNKDESYDIPPTIDTAGIEEVDYSKLDGIPSETGSIFIVASNGDYREIVVDEDGVVHTTGVQSAPDGDAGGSLGGSAGGPGGNTGGTQGSSNGGTSSQGGSSAVSSAGTTSGSSSGGSSSRSSSSSGGTTSGSSSGGATSSTSSRSSNASAASSTSAPAQSSSSPSPASSSSSSASNGGSECDTVFSVDNSRVETVGTNDVQLRVLGSEITYGANGPPIAVRMAVKTDEGNSWTDLFGGNAIATGNQQTLSNLPDGTPIYLSFNGRYSWLFNKTYASDNPGGHIIVLKNGDSPPAYAPFAHQASLASYLRSILDSKGKISIGPKDLVFLVELGSLDSQSSDFQDAVVLMTFTKKAYTCNSATEARLRVDFDRLENYGKGNSQKVTYVGPSSVAFSDAQWIPLKLNGQMIVDGGLTEDVPGLALERGPGWVHVILHGSHSDSTSRELLDARMTFDHAVITSTVNDTGQNQTENPTDGVVNDGPGGDEFVAGPTSASMTFKTRVTTEDDGVYLYWGSPSSSSSSSVSSASNSSASVASASSTSSVASTDACKVAYHIDSNGRLILDETSDVSISIEGSDSTYGYRGPKVSVRSSISFNDGSSWDPLFGYRSLLGGETKVYRNVAAGSRIVMNFEGRYSWIFKRLVMSGRADDHVRVLRNGDFAPQPSIANVRSSFNSFMREILDANGTRLKIGPREVAFLIELSDIDQSSDYQDAVVVLSIEKPGCHAATTSSSSISSASSKSSSSSTAVSSSSSSKAKNNDDDDGDGVKNKNDLCPNTFMPESVPTQSLLFDRYALTEGGSAIFRKDPTKKVGGYTLNDTAGCSCSQLLDVIDGTLTGGFDNYPSLQRRMRNLFSFYVESSRMYGCPASLFDMVISGL